MGPLLRGLSLEALPRRRTVKSHIQRNSVTVKTRFAVLLVQLHSWQALLAISRRLDDRLFAMSRSRVVVWPL